MLQVPPTGLQPSRTAAKVPHAEPAEAGFPAIALLAAAQLPPSAKPSPAREPATSEGPDAREASVSQQEVEPKRSGDPNPVQIREEEPEEPGKDAPPAAKEGVPTDPAAGGPALATGEMDPGQALTTPAAAPLPLPAGGLPQPAAAAAQPGAATAPIAPARVQNLPEAPDLGVPAPPPELSKADGKAAQAAWTAASTPGQPTVPAGAPSTTAAAAQEAPLAEARIPVSSTPQAESVPPLLAKASRTALTNRAAGLSQAATPEAESLAAGPDRTTGSAPGSSVQVAQRTLLPATPVGDLPTAGSFKAAQPEVPFQAPPALPVNVRFSGPAGPARPAEVEPAEKAPAKATESRRPAEEAQPRRADAATPAADSGAARPAPSSTESATALPRSESLGMQPTQLQPAALSGSTAQAAGRVELAAAWQVPVPPVPQQVENSIRWMLRNASPGAELQLHPEALGRVRIELKVEGGEVHAKLWASDPKSIPVLQEHKAFLEVSLKEQGLNLGSFDLRQNSNQAHPGFADGPPRGQFWPTEAGTAEPRQDAPSRPALRSANPRRIELIA